MDVLNALQGTFTCRLRVKNKHSQDPVRQGWWAKQTGHEVLGNSGPATSRGVSQILFYQKLPEITLSAIPVFKLWHLIPNNFKRKCWQHKTDPKQNQVNQSHTTSPQSSALCLPCRPQAPSHPTPASPTPLFSLVVLSFLMTAAITSEIHHEIFMRPWLYHWTGFCAWENSGYKSWLRLRLHGANKWLVEVSWWKARRAHNFAFQRLQQTAWRSYLISNDVFLLFTNHCTENVPWGWFLSSRPCSDSAPGN